MKKIIISAAVLVLGLAVQAQEIPERKTGKPGMHKRHKARGDIDMKALNLTDAQKEQFKKEREIYRVQMLELKKNENITVKDWKARKETLRKDHKAKVSSILTAEQKAQAKKMKAEGKARHEGVMKKRGDDMKTRLGLSDEQSAKLAQNRKAAGDKMKAIREDKSLNEEQKKERMKEVMKGQKESTKSILTEEQMQKMKEARKHKGGKDHNKTKRSETKI